MALPPTIQTIVSVIGYGPAMSLVKELGGQNFRFPSERSGTQWEVLVEIVGPQPAARLVERYRGEEVYIALCDRALKQDRNRRMIARYDALLCQGHSSRGAVSVLVREFRPISYRMVEIVVNGLAPSAAPEMELQGSLF